MLDLIEANEKQTYALMRIIVGLPFLWLRLKQLDFGQEITVLANIGVIAGIILLAVEISQNNEALGTQARLERESVLRDAMIRRLENPSLIRASVKARSGEALTGEEILPLDEMNSSAPTDVSLIYGQVTDGLPEEEAIPILRWREGFHRIYPRMEESWSEHRAVFAPKPTLRQYIFRCVSAVDS